MIIVLRSTFLVASLCGWYYLNVSMIRLNFQQLLLLFIITLKQNIYNYMPEINDVSRVYSVQLFCSYSYKVTFIAFITIIIIFVEL